MSVGTSQSVCDDQLLIEICNSSQELYAYPIAINQPVRPYSSNLLGAGVRARATFCLTDIHYSAGECGCLRALANRGHQQLRQWLTEVVNFDADGVLAQRFADERFATYHSHGEPRVNNVGGGQLLGIVYGKYQPVGCHGERPGDHQRTRATTIITTTIVTPTIE